MYRVTHALAVGRYLTPERVPQALALGATHALNVSDAPNSVAPGALREVVYEPLVDFRRIPEARLIVILHALHRMASEPGALVYVHCLAGHQRSPTILWLYLIALGLPPDLARDWIEEASPDAVPGHDKLCDPDLVLFAQKYGAEFLTPVPRAEILQRAT